MFNKLKSLSIGEVRYFESIGSTNDEALAWAAKGAQDLSLVIADEQTAGRGRLNRKWFTPKGTALAMSLILRPIGRGHLSRTVGLGALSITDALIHRGLEPQIKWPNDILLNGKKAAGILVETVWAGADVDSLVIGMGVNVARESVPPADQLQFPATCIEAELGQSVDREELVHDIVSALFTRRAEMYSDDFMNTWQARLAYLGRQVQIKSNNESRYGEVLGLEPDGSLRLRDERNEIAIIHVGDVSLRPAA